MSDTIDKIRAPHTGAAILALKAEIYKRHYLEAVKRNDHGKISKYKKWFNINGTDEVCKKSVVIVPVTVSYYPLRPGENFVKGLVKLLFKDIPPRIEEELEVEGNLLLKDSDINIYFDRPLSMDHYAKPYFSLTNTITPFLRSIDRSNLLLKILAIRLTKLFMHQIYTNLKVNIDHLFCAGLYQLKSSHISSEDYKRALFLTADSIKKNSKCRIHQSVTGKQLISLVTDEPSSPVEDVKNLADSLRMLDYQDGKFHTNMHRLNMRHRFHTIRVKNPVKVIANDLEPSQDITSILRRYVNTDSRKLQKQVHATTLEYDLTLFHRDYQKYYDKDLSKSPNVGSPFFLASPKSSVGIVLCHGLLSAPEEIRPLANYLNNLGYTVYGVRLRGHGTVPSNLRTVTWRDWYYSYLRGYAVLKNSCENILFGGFSTGGILALLAAATRCTKVKGVFAINSPISLKDIKARRSIAVNFWNDFLRKINVKNGQMEFIESQPENPEINYSLLYVKALDELKKLMTACWSSLQKIEMPSLIIQAKHDPIVSRLSARKIYSRIVCDDKTLRYTNHNRHVIVRGQGSERVFFATREFIQRILPVAADH